MLPDPLADQPATRAPGEVDGCSPGHPPVPSTPRELVAMQRLGPEERLATLLAQLRSRGLSPWESQQLALNLLQQLENYHHAVLAEMQDTADNTAAQVACWAIDGDRLMQARRLLESITLI